MSDDNEAWRGDSPRPRPRNPLEALFGLGQPIELTDEQKATLAATAKARRAEAEVRSLLTPPFNALATCVKCGGAKLHTRYCLGGATDTDVLNDRCFVASAGREHLTRICKACGYSWIEWCADHSAAGTPQ